MHDGYLFLFMLMLMRLFSLYPEEREDDIADTTRYPDRQEKIDENDGQ